MNPWQWELRRQGPERWQEGAKAEAAAAAAGAEPFV